MTDQAPAISVIMPMHDVAPYVSEALRSILDQTWRDLEVILIDDGSTDQSRQKAEAECAHDNRVTIVAQANKGQSAARNFGLKIARGRYIYFFDSDDVLEPDALEICIGHAQRLGLDLVAFSGTAFYHDTDAVQPVQVFRKQNLLDPMTGQDLLAALCMTRSFSVSCCLYLFLRQLIETHPLRFDEGFIHEDETFTTLLYCYAERAISLENILFRRRIREGSTMTRPRALAHVAGCVKAAERLAQAIGDGSYPLSLACQKALRGRQRTLLRQAIINAELSGTKGHFANLLMRSFRIRDILRIDPLIVPFALWCSLMSLMSRLRTKTV
ncbi:MAG: glycosyltransferase [Rhodocyclaceae bacterium]